MTDRAAVIDTESRRLAEVLSATDPERRCPTCPEWTAADLLWHLTEVHLLWSAVLGLDIRTDADVQRAENAKPARPERLPELLAPREQATAALLRELARHDDAEPRWSWWSPDRTVGFTRRMQTYEATVHRVDAELTAGLPLSPITPEVAAGAVDHAVDVMWGWPADGAGYHPTAVVELVASDTGQRWLVEVGTWTAGQDESYARAVRATSGEPRATATATLTDLALWAWTRGGSAHLTGEQDAIDALNVLVKQGMQ
ncbi:maleylpyruvate isomerase family mycothiol-dependent enzyme [Nocardia sp. NPDC057227]|uniref:maleylpyruvate isomerase family mycothiol-dependent enzyme n=1 Tax=Nocardia sp. NPDC057227 TaxID=3346056 RepID=UPI00363052C5